MIELHNLHDIDFHINKIFVRMENWDDNVIHDYSSLGRVNNLIHIITSGNRSYTINGRSFVLKAGELLFIPHGTRYITRTIGKCAGIGICFELFSDSGSIELVRDVYHSWSDPYGDYLGIFSEMLDGASSHTSLHCMTLMWKLLDKMISEQDDLTLLGRMIAPAVTFIHEHFRENLHVSDYAAVCHLSESHFRRMFHEYTGMAPLEYRDSLRFDEAERLYTDGRTMTDIAEQLGFCDASYLRRLYKKRRGHDFRDCRLPKII